MPPRLSRLSRFPAAAFLLIAASPLHALCPVGMADIGGKFCVDRYEAALVEVTERGDAPWSPFESPVAGRKYKAVVKQGGLPQAYISANQAAGACSAAGKRLCRLSEWVGACKGPDSSKYPYGANYEPLTCNEHAKDKAFVGPLQRLFGAKLKMDWAHMNDPRLNQLPDTVAPSGRFARCTNPFGVFDMVGNLHEWVADRRGSNGLFKGGYFNEAEINGPGCEYTTSAHAPDYHDYSTGFRCCGNHLPLGQ